MLDYQGMVVLAANQIWWTWEVEDVFRKVMNGDKLAMKNYAKQLHSQIDDLGEFHFRWLENSITEIGKAAKFLCFLTI